MLDTNLRITEIFYSLQGEASNAGYPTVFVRLTGCPLRCTYCDSAYAFNGGQRMSFSEIFDAVTQYGAQHVCVTGGEPLAQGECMALLSELCDRGWQVSLETSGAMDIEGVDERVAIVMDLKTPASGELDKNLWSNISRLSKKDQIKFVVCDRADFDWAMFNIDERRLFEHAGEVFISPSYGTVQPEELAQWVLESRRPIRMQLQMHKLLWGDKPGV